MERDEPMKGRFSDLGEDVGQIAQKGVEQARRIGEEAKARALREAEERKGELAERLEDLATRLESTGETEEGVTQQMADSGARVMRRVSSSLRERSTRELLDAAQRRMAENPGAMFAGALALGFLGARMLRR